MQTLTVKDFVSGWIPSDDQVSGRRNGLVRMDNCQLDETAALTIVRGATKVNGSAFLDYPHSIYSKVIAGVKYRYVGLHDSTVLRDDGTGAFGLTIGTGGSTPAAIKTAFGTAYDFALIFSGDIRVKDNGTTQYQLGVSPPQTQVGVSAGTDIAIGVADSNYGLTATEGTVTYSDATVFVADPSATTFRFEGYKTFASPVNTMDYGSSRYGTDDDLFTFDFRIPDTEKFDTLQIFLYFGTVDGSPDSSPDLVDYYSFEIRSDSDQIIRGGVNQWSKIKVARKDFQREGTDDAKNWTNIKGIRVVALFTEVVTQFAIGSITLIGSSAGPLTGRYEYLQVNVGNHGYFAKSQPGPEMNYWFEINNSYAVVTPSDPAGVGDTQINEVWIYRRRSNVPGSDPLAQFLRVKQLTSSLGAAFFDAVSDDDALLEGEVLNQNTQSISEGSFPSDVYYMETNYFERALYMTPREVYLSEELNPDAVDLRFTIKLSGDKAELNLWMIKSGPSQILIGTTNDIYEISGTLRELPDGTIDAIVRPMGIKQPPIYSAVCLYKNAVYYIGTDGINKLQGAVNVSFNGNLDLLWAKNDRYGVLSFLKQSEDPADLYRKFNIVASKGKLFVHVTHSDGTAGMVVHDFKRDYWYRYLINPSALAIDEDDTLLVGFVSPGDYYIRIVDTGTLYDGVGQTILLRFPVLDDNLPLNRKDSFTFKLKVDTGGISCTLKIYKDESSSPITVGTFSSVGVTEKNFDISSSVGIAKSFQIEISGSALTAFRLNEWAIEYDPRPKQTRYLRIPPSNFNIAGRKRVPTIPMLIDTLGGDVTFTPAVDLADQTPSTINNADKQVYNHYFTSDQIGYVFGGKLQGNSYFEFYEMITPRITELLPDPAKFFVVPENNFGIAAKKRVRTLPLIINTKGQDVVFTPIVDNVAGTPTTFNTPNKQTVLHYFTVDSFGIDYKGTFAGTTEFEFYEMLKPEDVQVLPVGKKFDQVGPIEFARIGKVIGFRLRIVCEGISLAYVVYGDDDVTLATGTITTIANKDEVYEVMLAKGTNMTIGRITFSSANPFHRYYARVKVNKSGMPSEPEWMMFGADPDAKPK